MGRIIVTLLMTLSFSFASLTQEDNGDQLRTVFHSLQLDDSFMDHTIYSTIQKGDRFSQQRFIDIYGHGAIFIPTIQDIFIRQNIPDLFAYMPVIESGYTTRARSHAGAVGLWQLVPETARNFGLKVSRKVDERKDPVKSTRAVARYINALHDKFGKWYLVAMAYSCGEGTLQRAIAKAGTDRAEVLLDPSRRYLPAETRGHFTKLLTVYAMSRQGAIQDAMAEKIRRTENVKITTVWVKKGVSIQTVASKIGMSRHDLARLNGHVGSHAKKEKNGYYSLNIPETKVDAFYAAINGKS